LDGTEKEEFFNAAGLVTERLESEEVEWARVIFEFYKRIDFPGFVVDELSNVHSLNSYMVELLEIEFEKPF